MILAVILVSDVFYFREENYEDEFKNNKKIVVKTLYSIKI